MESVDYDAVNIDEANYPVLLKRIDDPPENLFYRGDWREELFERCLAVVGSRRMSTYGKRVSESLVFEIAARGVTIVSGFMYGIDMTAHKSAIAAGGRTIAVLAYGIKKKPADYLSNMYQEIIDSGGLVISELGEDEPPKKWSFPKRNRIIAGLSQAVLVVEAAENSGSLITAEFAKSFGRRVFAVPGPIDLNGSKGTLKLIAEGAEMVRSSQDVLRFFSGEENGGENKGEAPSDLGGADTKLIRLLRYSPLTLEEIVLQVSDPIEVVSQQITMLQLSGWIEETEGRFYARHS